MCSYKTWRKLTLPYYYGLTFHSLSSASGSKRKHTTPTDHWAVWSCTPDRGFCLFPFAVHKQTWGNAAVGIGNGKQGTDTRRQAKAWGSFCFAFGNNLPAFCQHDNCFFPKHVGDSKRRKQSLAGPSLQGFWPRSQETQLNLLCQLRLLPSFSGCIMGKWG